MKLKDIVDNQDVFSRLPKEHQLFAMDLKAEFESDGIHLEGEKHCYCCLAQNYCYYYCCI